MTLEELRNVVKGHLKTTEIYCRPAKGKVISQSDEYALELFKSIDKYLEELERIKIEISNLNFEANIQKSKI